MKRKLFLIYWIIPGYLCFLLIYQTLTYWGIMDTFNNGTTYMAQVDEFKLKNMQSQSSGYIDISFDIVNSNSTFKKRLSLPVQIAAQLQIYGTIPIRYKPDSFIEIVFVPIWEFHAHMVLMNIAIISFFSILTLIIGYWITKYTFKKTQYEIEREQLVDMYHSLKQSAN